MLNRSIVWTGDLARAAYLIAKDAGQQDATRAGLAADIRDRARELARLYADDQLAAHQVAWVQAFRSRLSDPYVTFSAAEDFETAWSAAFKLAAD